MKATILHKLILYSLPFMLTSCEKDFLIDEFLGDNKTTVNCLFDKENQFKIFVTQSSHPTQNTSTIAPQDVWIELFENDSLVGVVPYIPANAANSFGSYNTTFIPIEGKKYALKVARPGLPLVTAQDTMPTSPQVINYKVSAYTTTPTQSNVQFSFTLSDQNPNQLDYYRIQTFHSYSLWVKTSPNDSSLKHFYEYIQPSNLSPLADIIDDHGWSYLFSDKDFNGLTKNITTGFQSLDTTKLTALTVHLDIIKVSQNHWNYFQTLEKFNNSNKETDPAPVFSNIANGYGIFMSQNIKRLSVQIK